MTRIENSKPLPEKIWPDRICGCCGKWMSEIDAYWWKYVEGVSQ